MVWLYLALAGIAVIGLIQTIRGHARQRVYLEQAGDPPPLQLSHLPSALQRLAADTRALRISLESPLRELETLHASPEDAQHSLAEATRELGEWVQAVQRLSLSDRAHLRDVGANPDRITALYLDEDWSLGSLGAHFGDARMRDRIARLMQELERFEERLQTTHSPYR